MKKWALLILLILGLSWMTSLAEGLMCDADGHDMSAQLHEESAPKTDSHACHVGSCHFGHCSHVYARLASTSIMEPDGHAGPHVTPYFFITISAPDFSLMRPPLA
ncbi:MAG TPA: hypothetical protein VFO10_22105 [Oligoflexus sp.]|uniref:hypothetical protein n=1 Tax=Oligoflexus sp. TaxID=1971216 RepID=UPI002D7F4B99|nr:hypothetical protein [Oligoflexus sp.]HET9239971.1 hypothetical protein [Oligoflexus sp.]